VVLAETQMLLAVAVVVVRALLVLIAQVKMAVTAVSVHLLLFQVARQLEQVILYQELIILQVAALVDTATQVE
jgi:hypothetical protein